VNGHGSNVKVIDPVLRKIRYDTGALVAFYKPYAERYMGLVKDLMENPPEETPGWHSSELETSQMLAHNAKLVRMDRATHTETHIPGWLPAAFKKADGAPDVEFKGYQYFQFPMDHDEFTDTGVIGNPMRATAEKGEQAFQRYATHLVEAIAELSKVDVQVFNREFRERV
jgi:creatinine amidohydrolase